MALPWQHSVYRRFRDEEEVGAVVAKNANVDGVFGLPAPPFYEPSMDKAARAAVDQRVYERLQSGPLLTVVFQRTGYSSLTPKLIRAALTGMLCSFVFTIFVMTVSAEIGFAHRVLIVTLGALGTASATRIPDWNWHGYSPAFVAVQIADAVVGCAIIASIASFITLRYP